jgi:ketosteroid isomerase-like protein
MTTRLEPVIRYCFTAWTNRDWDSLESLLADGFTFTSPYDDHIQKHEYKQKCWDAVRDIGEYEYVSIMESGDEAFVRYKARINGMAVQNTEHFIVHDGKIKSVDVFFGRPE